ncbi:cyclin-I isoform X2 [Coregonus clupeaformis]|uniref:cyclin-I isoform X2 n=1 Tax=Coregonus clupeaformis TaxID=59861 RepID=UPI001E1C8989|nr:cyclin-I isoform X2 [Coregonus clupeaformis]
MMKFAEPLESQRLSFLLEKAASREAQMWKAYVPKKTYTSVQDTDISPAQRDEAVYWLIDLNSDTKLYPETLSLAISILDRFLGAIKARPKYLRCIAIACYFLAAKSSEEDERVPLLRDLASSSSCGCSPSEILRMERIILDKLNWDLHTATPLEFLHIFHAMVLSCKSRFLVGLVGCNPSQHLSVLTQQLHYCLADSTLLQPLSRGSMLALALITLELENICPDWLALTILLLSKAQIDSSQLIRCRELVSRRLSTQEASLPPNTVYIYQPLDHSLASDPCDEGEGDSNTRLLSPVTDPPAPAPRDRSLSRVSSTTALLQVHGPPMPSHHPHQVHLRCKLSAKRKVRAWLLHQPEWRRWRSTNSTTGSNGSTAKRAGVLRRGRW